MRSVLARCAGRKLGLPVDANQFVENLRDRMIAALHEFNRILPRQPHVRIYCPNKKRPHRGLFTVAKLERQKEPKSLDLIKDGIVKDFGMLELLDIFVEADRLVDFTRFFTHSGTKEVRSREALRPLLILDLFAEATYADNVGQTFSPSKLGGTGETVDRCYATPALVDGKSPL
jgi:hypothetical protein